MAEAKETFLRGTATFFLACRFCTRGDVGFLFYRMTERTRDSIKFTINALYLFVFIIILMKTYLAGNFKFRLKNNSD